MTIYDSEIAEFLTDKMNEEYTRFGVALPFSLAKRNKNNQIIAAASGSIVYGAIYTDQLWVHHDYRKKGLGFELMRQIHDLGISHNCTIATVCTMSFQEAKDFYINVGYKVDFERKGYAKNSKCIFLKRVL